MTILKQPFIEKNIKGKPYITVSAKGIANGLSDTPNDGADFGPDTMLNATDPSQIGPPYTQTTGLAEAVYYQANIEHKKIVLTSGIYHLNAQVPLYNGTVIEGALKDGAMRTELQLTTDLGNQPVMPFASSSLAGIRLKNLFFNGLHHTASAIIDFSVFPEGAYLNVLEDIFSEFTENFNYDFILDHMEDSFCNRCYLFGNVSWQAYGGASYYLNGAFNKFIAGSYNTVISNTVIWDSITLIGNNTPSPGPTLTLNSLYVNNTSTSPFIVGPTNPNTWFINCNGCIIFANQNKGNPYPLFSLQSGVSSAKIVATFIGTNIEYVNVSSSGFVPYPMFASGITGKAVLQNVRSWYLQVPNNVWTDWQNWLVDYNPKNQNIFSVTTPAVPASGKAITNNNPFSVDIYITNAGSVSSYQINNITFSAGLSVGQKITLAPGGTLTLTYTTAPTWTWTFHV